MSLSISEAQSRLEEVFGICRFIVRSPHLEEEIEAQRPLLSTACSSTGSGDRDVETVEEVKVDLGRCERCVLCDARTHLVFSSGPSRADVMVVGEPPGEEEDAEGTPFVGPSGLKLNAMLLNVLGLDRDKVHVTNALKCRPPQNRVPNPEEIESCRPFLLRQIRAVQPKILILLGSVAVKAVFPNFTVGVSKLRGRWLELESIRVMPTFHPSFLLHQRKPGSEDSPQNLEYRKNTRLVWADLVEVRDRMDLLGIDHQTVTSRP